MQLQTYIKEIIQGDLPSFEELVELTGDASPEEVKATLIDLGIELPVITPETE